MAWVLLWPSDRGPSAPPENPAPAPSKAESAPGPGRVAPPDLRDLIENLMRGMRVPVRAGSGGFDLVAVPPGGRSVLFVNGEIDRAVRFWGGQVESADEYNISKSARGVDLRISFGEERCRVRLEQGVAPSGPGRIALVIDDFGFQSSKDLEGFLRLALPFTPAVLPGYPRSEETARRFLLAGRPPLLHLPLEPIDAAANDPGPEAIRSGMEAREVATRVRRLIDATHGIVGVNHHMGSHGSADPALMEPILEAVGKAGLFYLDSVTSDQSVCAAVAARIGVPCLTADLFLDGDRAPTRKSMGERLKRAAALARANGSAILIAHARRPTLEFLSTAGDSLARTGILFVPLDELLR